MVISHVNQSGVFYSNFTVNVNMEVKKRAVGIEDT